MKAAKNVSKSVQTSISVPLVVKFYLSQISNNCIIILLPFKNSTYNNQYDIIQVDNMRKTYIHSVSNILLVSNDISELDCGYYNP